VYAVGIVVENLRDRELEFHWSTTPGSSAGSTVPSTPPQAAAPLVSSSPPPPQITASTQYTCTAWLDDIRPPHSVRPRPSNPSSSPSFSSSSSPPQSPFATTLATATPAAAGFEPEDGGSFALRDEMRADGAMHAMQYASEQEKREQQEELGALEAAFAAGAGVAVAVGVLLGGFGGGS